VVVFNRELKTVGSLGGVHQEASHSKPFLQNPVSESKDTTVLVINASHEMAKEITLQLTLKIPGCSIAYAPTLELARFVLTRKKIDLIVSSPVLPDGSILKLKEILNELQNAPDLVVVGNINIHNAETLSQMGYEYVKFKKLSLSSPRKETSFPIIHKRKVDESLKSLGADIRNDLNNPLQEIVAMVFVAKATGESETTSTALEAIDKAAQNLASIVSGLEDKIRGAVVREPTHF
jgi:hypothetical protein